jgi:hypothetical protein
MGMTPNHSNNNMVQTQTLLILFSLLTCLIGCLWLLNFVNSYKVINFYNWQMSGRKPPTGVHFNLPSLDKWLLQQPLLHWLLLSQNTQSPSKLLPPPVGVLDVGFLDVGFLDVGFLDVGFLDVGLPVLGALAGVVVGSALVGIMLGVLVGGGAQLIAFPLIVTEVNSVSPSYDMLQ